MRREADPVASCIEKGSYPFETMRNENGYEPFSGRDRSPLKATLRLRENVDEVPMNLVLSCWCSLRVSGHEVRHYVPEVLEA